MIPCETRIRIEAEKVETPTTQRNGPTNDILGFTRKRGFLFTEIVSC